MKNFNSNDHEKRKVVRKLMKIHKDYSTICNEVLIIEWVILVLTIFRRNFEFQ